MSVHRQLSCLLLLQHERKQTAAQLAERLEVSVRTVYRDVDTLSSAGVPIHMERGAGGGIVLADDYRRALANFTNDDIAALFAASASPMRDLGIRDAGDALRKLAGALNARQREAAANARETLLVDHNRWYRPEQPRDALALARGAIESRNVLEMRYRDRRGAFSRRRVAPLGLVTKAGAWYLVAREDGKGDRTFRVDRIDDVVVAEQRFARPADFDLSAHWEASIASLERSKGDGYDFVLRVRPELTDRVVPFWGAQVLEASPDGIVAAFRVPSGDVAASLVVALGDGADIVRPDELRELVVSRARSAVAHHAARRST